MKPFFYVFFVNFIINDFYLKLLGCFGSAIFFSFKFGYFCVTKILQQGCNLNK
jgi:hypothetical protein